MRTHKNYDKNGVQIDPYIEPTCGCRTGEIRVGLIAWCPLHAAAPAMLEALEEMVIYAEGVPGEGFAKARAAIRQAKGDA
jgi:hypothetical protein